MIHRDIQEGLIKIFQKKIAKIWPQSNVFFSQSLHAFFFEKKTYHV